MANFIVAVFKQSGFCVEFDDRRMNFENETKKLHFVFRAYIGVCHDACGGHVFDMKRNKHVFR